MKKIFKILSAVLAIVLMLSSCSSVSPEKATEKIGAFLNAGQYNECKSFIDSLSSETKDEINSEALKLIKSKHIELSEKEKINYDNIYDLSLYSKAFTEESRSLWNIASLFKIDIDNESYGDFVYLRYFAVMNDMVKYRELYALMKSVEKSGYLEELSEALYNYNEKSVETFMNCYKNASAFDYSEFDPGQYMISDFRKTHDDIVKNLKSTADALASSDAKLIASCTSALKEDMTSAIRTADTLKAVYSKQVVIFKALTDGKLYEDFDTAINPSEREYEPGMSLSLDYIFKTAPSFIGEDDTQDSTAIGEKTISKEKAVETVNKAINKTKAFTGETKIALTEQRNVQMTDFRTENGVATAAEIAKSQVNDYLRQTNGKKQEALTFTNGANGEQTLSTFIPPSGKNAALSASAVTEYTAVQGNGGYVITLKLPSETSKKDSPAVNILSIINGSSFDGLETASDSETYYAPSYITVTVNNNGMLSKLQYSISGVSNCEFIDTDSEKINAEFSFDNKFTYEFRY